MADNKRRRVVVVGLDGATLDVIRPLIEVGRLPTLARLMREGAHGELTTTIPPVTAPAGCLRPGPGATDPPTGRGFFGCRRPR